MSSYPKWLRKAASEIRLAGHNGWGNTCADAAEHLEHCERECTALQSTNAELVEALRVAERSLRTIAERKGFADHEDFLAGVRPYAAYRAKVAREALTKANQCSTSGEWV